MIAENHTSQKEILLGLRKSIWMINAIIEMVEKDKYCVEIATQVNATMWLLKGVNQRLLENHLSCCWPKFLNAQDSGVKETFIKELIRARNVTSK